MGGHFDDHLESARHYHHQIFDSPNGASNAAEGSCPSNVQCYDKPGSGKVCPNNPPFAYVFSSPKRGQHPWANRQRRPIQLISKQCVCQWHQEYLGRCISCIQWNFQWPLMLCPSRTPTEGPRALPTLTCSLEPPILD